MNLRIKSPEDLIKQSENSTKQLNKHLDWKSLTIMGISVLIGAGIFTVTASTAGDNSGPGTSVAFLMAAVACAFTAMCYAEFASTVPVTGSVYTYSYATFGEFIAWVMGWVLVLEFTLAPAFIAKSWSTHLAKLFGQDNFIIKLELFGSDFNVDIMATLLVLALTAVLVKGISQSTKLATVLTIVKISVVFLMVVAGLTKIKKENYTPFIPAEVKLSEKTNNLDSTLLSAFLGQSNTQYGIYGLFAGASVLFFAFIGFDVVATSAEETKNPKKDLPKGIFASLGIVTILYIIVALVVTGVAPYTELKTKNINGNDQPADLVTAFEYANLGWVSKIVALGAIAGLTTVSMFLMLAQSRVLFAVSRDGLLPKGFSKTNENGSPTRIVITVGIIVAIISGFIPISGLAEMINIATLLSFVVVAIGVMVLRRTKPDLKRGYKVPFVPLIPVLAVLSCVWLMINLKIETWLYLIVWVTIGIVIYFSYGYRNSSLAKAVHK